MKPDSLVVTAFGALSLLAGSASAQIWTLVTNAPSASVVASSADGSKLVAAGNLIYTSTNSGATWTTSAAPNAVWSSVASSADGSHLIAAAFDFGSGSFLGLVYTSTNSGASWTPTGLPNAFWQAVASSADGNKLVAANDSQIYTSTNGGATWTLTSAPGQAWSALASSADGNKLVAAAIYGFLGAGGQIYTSTNAGVTWTATSAPNWEWSSVASAADGTRLVAAANKDRNSGQPGWLYISLDSGANWQVSNVRAPAYWSSVASSADGSHLVAVARSDTNFNSSPIYFSLNGGGTWTYTSVPDQYWSGVASSADGCNLLALGNSGSPANQSSLYTFTCSGARWTRSRIHYQRLKSFEVSPHQLGGAPQAPVMEGNDGWLYGTTSSGGTAGYGTVFKMTKDGSGFTILHHFNFGDGAYPQELIQSGDLVLYGTTASGGSNNYGTVFRMNRDGSGYQVLRNLPDVGGEGYNPVGGVVEGSTGALYGVTSYGGTNGRGTIFKINKDGSGYGVLHHFWNAAGDGYYPLAGLIKGSGGEFYGTTAYGGTNGGGTLFRINQDGSDYRILWNFGGPFNAVGPLARLLQGGNSILYSTTSQGGSNNVGTVFKINPDGSGFAVLHHFGISASDGDSPRALLQGSDSALYGITSRGGSNSFGTVFKLLTDGSDYSVLHDFNGPAGDGSYPEESLLSASNGALYGVTSSGGSNYSGTVFKLNQDGSGFDIVHNFGGGRTPGSQTQARLLEGADKVLYGTAFFGTFGTIFKLKKDGSGYGELHTLESPGGLVEGSDGLLYGTSPSGGSNGLGSIFRLQRNGGNFSLVYSFDNGSYYPDATLLQATDGALYGTTLRGGANFVGTVFKLNHDGSGFTILASLGACCPFGVNTSRLLEGSDGKLYGTTSGNRSNDFGSVFLLNKNGTSYAILYAPSPDYLRPNDGLSPDALVKGSDGALYCTTSYGGTFDNGTLFKFELDGSGYSLLLGFSRPGMYDPGQQAGLLEGLDGALYGTTAKGGVHDLGTIFRVNKDGSDFAVLHDFGDCPADGQAPSPALVRGSDGALYGTTGAGGDMGLGTVFRIWPPQTPDMIGLASIGNAEQVSFTGLSFAHYAVLRSTDLSNWVVLTNITMPPVGFYTNVDNAPPKPSAYYRAVWVP